MYTAASGQSILPLDLSLPLMPSTDAHSVRPDRFRAGPYCKEIRSLMLLRGVVDRSLAFLN
jgi:hypothetical protein